MINVKLDGKQRRFNYSAWLMIALAIIVGVLGGLFAVLFRYMIDWSHNGFYGVGKILFGFLPGNLWIIMIPAIAGLVVGPLIYFFAREAKGHGVPEVMESVALKGGRMRMRVIFVKAIASASSIGAGASVGREGPIIQMGSGIGSVLGQWFKLKEDKVKMLVACGAAAGISATFNAPIAGVMFSQEIILNNFTSSTFVPIVISSVTASAVSRMFLGDTPAFLVQAFVLHSPIELIFYAVLGIISAVIAFVFVKTLYATEDFFDAIKAIPEWLKPVFGGLMIGLIGLKFPQVLGVGYESIGKALNGQFVMGTLLMLVIVKLLATSLTLGSGHSGGVFAPSLFAGAALGGAFGLLLKDVFPAIVGNPGAYAIAGMGAVVAGATQAPITAVLIIFEMTRDYHIVLPLMIAVVFSTNVFAYLSRVYLQKGNIYTLKLLRRGVNLQDGRDVNIMKLIKVSDVMSTPVEVVREDDKMENVIQMMHDGKHNGFPTVNDKGELAGIITLQDIRDIPVKGIMEILVSQISSNKLVVIYPSKTIDDVFGILQKYDIGHLPVVNPDNPKELIGILTRSDIVKAYDKEMISIARNRSEA